MEELKNENLIEAINNLRKSKDKGWKEKNYYIIINHFGNKLVVEDRFMKELLNQ